MEWLLSSLDPGRAHLVEAATAWHARLMVLAWAALVPLGVLLARFFKVTPRQNWPAELDNPLWWRAHLWLQGLSAALMLAGFVLIARQSGVRVPTTAHALFGYGVLALAVCQYAGGLLRGTKGGPREPSLRGDHYDMTPRRIWFEYGHKSLGYLALALAVAAIVSGLWQANAPRWMVLVIGGWWGLWLFAFVRLQRQGRAIDTYHAIWGPSPDHPGNHRAPIGWGITRRSNHGREQP